MSFRAVLWGLLLGMSISALTYYNDQIIRQTFLIGNHLPVSVFGTGLMMLLISGALWRRVGQSRPFTAGEIGIVMAFGLAVCGWPGSNLFRYFAYPLSLPAVQENLQPNWMATRVMSYVPGGSPLLAEGYVRDWKGLVRRLNISADDIAAENHEMHLGEATLSFRLRQHISDSLKDRLVDLDQGEPLTSRDRDQLIRQINLAMQAPDLLDGLSWPNISSNTAAADLWQKKIREHHLTQREVEQLHRLVMETIWPGVLRSRKHGTGVLLADGQADAPAVQALVTRTGDWAGLSFMELPWAEWWPTLRLWGGSALLLGVASLGMVMVVHPQWYQRELLPYPTVKFVELVTARAPDQRWPVIFRSRLFWIALGIVVFVHLINGLNAWYPQIPAIQRQFDFGGMRVLFPNAATVYGADYLFSPMFFASAVGFAFLINTRVSLSLGLSLFCWVAMGAWMRSFGLTLEADRYNIGASGTNLRFGAYLAATVMMLYVGRRHYWRVLFASLGFAPNAETPTYSVWGARLMVICSMGTVWLLHQYAGLDWILGTLLVLSTMIIFLVMSRLNAETGLFYAQPDWLPGIMIAGLIGLPVLGPEALTVILLAGVIWVVDPREAVAPYLLNGLAMTEQISKIPPMRSARWLLLMMILGLIVTLTVTLTLQYNYGLQRLDGWSMSIGSSMFNRISASISSLSASGELDSSMDHHGLSRWTNLVPERESAWWCLAGFVLLIGCSAARLRFAWWPLHPVLFLVWGTYPANNFAYSFLLASLLKSAIVWIGGEKAYHNTKPMAVGLIAGEILMIMFWALVGALYYIHTGINPMSYRILPG